MPILLAAAFWLIVTVHGEVVHKSGPMSGDDCALQMAFHILQAEQFESDDARFVIDGRIVTRDDVTIVCRPGERGT